MLAPQLEALVNEHPDAKLRIIRADEPWGSQVAAVHGVRRIPHLLLFRNGRLELTGKDEVLDALRP